nr:Rho GTPase-activating protein 5-like [Tanacetum cinerariifolium]
MTQVIINSNSPPSSPSLQDTLFQTLFTQETEQQRVPHDHEHDENDSTQLSFLAFLLTLFRRSIWGGENIDKDTVAEENLSGMEIGWPTDVRHVAHVTFDRFNGFLVLRRAPSASATVFGVSTESMHQGGLEAEGIFRINPDNSQEEHLRTQLNSGVIPDGIDAHCLAGLIKAWFRELPAGVLDPLAPEAVIQCQSEEDCTTLCRQLPPTETALLDWAINLMADVVQHEHLNKMNSHNIAMVFAPNMTQMVDPLTALMYAVQVMNFLKTLITKALREREDLVIETYPDPPQEPSDKNNGDQGLTLSLNVQENRDENEEREHNFTTDDDHLDYSTTSEESEGSTFCRWPPVEPKTTTTVKHTQESKTGQSSGQEKPQPILSSLRSLNPQKETQRCGKRSRITGAKLPPPVGKPWVCLKSFRENGRFILKEVKIPTQELLYACRENGRLKLQFIQHDHI